MHYPYVLSLNKLRLIVHLGFYDAERAGTQPIEICLRLYFGQAPAYAADEKLSFLDYASIAKTISDYVEARSFKLIEFMGSEIFAQIRALLDAKGLAEVKLWMCLNKIEAPVPGLMGGASYTQSDLPPNASVVAIHG